MHNLYSSSSSSDDDSGRNPSSKLSGQGKNFQKLIERWNDVERITDKFAGVSRNAEAGVDRVRQVGGRVETYIQKYQTAINNMYNTSCKTALDLLPLSKRSNGTQNEKSNEEVYKEKLEDFKLQLTELNEFFNKQQLTKDGRRRFIEDIVRIIVNISELSDLITDKSKPNTENVTISIKPPLIRCKYAPSAPILLSRSDHTKVLQSSSTRVNDVEQLLLTQRSPVAPVSRR